MAMWTAPVGRTASGCMPDSAEQPQRETARALRGCSCFVSQNVESVKYKNLDMTIWDVGGQDKIRPLWKHYYTNTDVLIYVVDSNDPDRIGEVRCASDIRMTSTSVMTPPFDRSWCPVHDRSSMAHGAVDCSK